MRVLVVVLVLCALVGASAIDAHKGKNRRHRHKCQHKVDKAALRAQAKGIKEWFQSLSASDWTRLQCFNKDEQKGCTPGPDQCCKKPSITLTDIRVDGLKMGWTDRVSEGKNFEFVLDAKFERDGGSWDDPCEIPDDCSTSLFRSVSTEDSDCDEQRAKDGDCNVRFNVHDDQNNTHSTLTFTDFDEGWIANDVEKVKELQLEVEIREEDPLFDDEMGFATVRGNELVRLCRKSGGDTEISIPLSTVSVGNIMANAGKALAMVGSQIASKATGAIGGAFAGAAGSEKGCKKVTEVMDSMVFTPEYDPTTVQNGATLNFKLRCCGFDDVQN